VELRNLISRRSVALIEQTAQSRWPSGQWTSRSLFHARKLVRSLMKASAPGGRAAPEAATVALEALATAEQIEVEAGRSTPRSRSVSSGLNRQESIGPAG